MPHLTYVGDATIGEESNIGASSVFVNYDGVRKHRTTIGSHVRTGSDTMFVAPVDGRRRRLHRRRHGAAARRPAGGAGGVGRITAHHRGLGREEPAGHTCCRGSRSVPLGGLRPTPPDQTTAEEALHDELDLGHTEEAPDALLRPGAPGAGRAGRQARSTSPSPRSRPTTSPTARSSCGSRSRCAALTRSSSRRTRAPINELDHGAADHGRRAQARVGQADHRGHAVLRATPARTRSTAAASRSRPG